MVRVAAILTPEEYASLRRYARLSKRSTATVAGSLIATALAGADDPEPLDNEERPTGTHPPEYHGGPPCGACWPKESAGSDIPFGMCCLGTEDGHHSPGCKNRGDA